MGDPVPVSIPDPGLLLLFGPAAPLLAQLPADALVEVEPLRTQMAWAGPDDDGRVWEVARAIVDARLRRGRLTVVPAVPDAEQAEALATVARRRHLPLTAIAVDRKGDEVGARNAAQRALAKLRKRKGVVTHTVKAPRVDGVAVTLTPPPTDRRAERGPFDVIGDLHGCLYETELLLEALGYAPDDAGTWRNGHRRAVFVGDLTDRGPDSVGTLELVRRMVAAGSGFCVRGNHDAKLLRWLEGRKVRVSHGLASTVAEVEALPEPEQAAFRARAIPFLAGLPTHLVLDGGRLVVAHAGIRESLIGRTGATVAAFTAYGDTTGKTDEHGLPERLDWAAKYEGSARVVYGHTPTPAAVVRHNTACVDQGCVFGGGLTAYCHPEEVFATVRAQRTYHAPWGGFRPLLLPPFREPSEHLPIDCV